MLEKIYAKNLGNPKGVIGKKVAKWFVENITCYEYLEQIENLAKYRKLLEIGYGNGEGIKSYAEKYESKIDGIDISKLMYKTAQRTNRKLIDNGKVRLFLGNFEFMIKERYNFIYLMNVVYFWTDIDDKIKNIIKLLNRSGKMLIFMGSPEYLMKGKISATQIFSKHKVDDIKEIYKKAGLIDIRVVEHNEEKGCYYIFGTKK